MKKTKYILAFLIILSTASCKKYLSVYPETQLPEDEMFSTQAGFESALTGVYIKLNADGLYGQAMTMTTIEELVSSWDVTAGSVEEKIGLFEYDDADVQGKFSSIFQQEYNTIANINSILSQIDSKKSVFKTPGMYQIIKSECLAIRAYCHLDLLRLFGPIPSNPSNGNMLAYVTTLSTSPNQRVSFEKYKADLLKDLQAADSLSKSVDPIVNYSLNDLRSFGPQNPTNTFNPTDTYLAYRYLRMNYYAIKALEARAYLWFGDNTNAYNSAMAVIDAKNADSTNKFVLGTAADFAAGNYTLTSEQIFGLYAPTLSDTYTSLYSNGTLAKGTTPSVIKNSLYGNTGTDTREASLWTTVVQSNGATPYVFKKYDIASAPTTLSTDFQQIPMLRLSEMYFIAIETGPTAEAQALWDAYKTSRNLASETLPAGVKEIQNTLLPEYRREFYAEGQAFFGYKRVNASISAIIFSPVGATVNYQIPLPKEETVNQN